MILPAALGELAEEPRVVAAGATASAAAREVQRLGARCLVVLGEGGRPQGLVTDRDLALGAMLRPPGSREPQVGELVRRGLTLLPADAPLRAATLVLGPGRAAWVGVVDRAGHLVGVVSFEGVVACLGAAFRGVAEKGPGGAT